MQWLSGLLEGGIGFLCDWLHGPEGHGAAASLLLGGLGLYIFVWCGRSYIYFNFSICLIFGCIGSLLLHAGFLQLWQAGATLCCGAWASRCSGFSCCGAWALGTWASVVAACGLSSCGSQALQCRLSSCGAWVSCPVACGIFPDQGSNLCPLPWQAYS